MSTESTLPPTMMYLVWILKSSIDPVNRAANDAAAAAVGDDGGAVVAVAAVAVAFVIGDCLSGWKFSLS